MSRWSSSYMQKTEKFNSTLVLFLNFGDKNSSQNVTTTLRISTSKSDATSKKKGDARETVIISNYLSFNTSAHYSHLNIHIMMCLNKVLNHAG